LHECSVTPSMDGGAVQSLILVDEKYGIVFLIP